MRILLAEDHQIVREGVRLLLERVGFDVVAETDNGEDAVQLARVHRPDVAILDLMMPRFGGIECARDILAARVATGVVLLSVSSDEDVVIAALRAGVRGYVVKTQAATELVRAVREVNAGGTYLSASISRIVAKLYVDGGTKPDALTTRQREVLRLVATGHSTREIATILAVSEKTVDLYRSRVMARLDLHDVAGLVRYAIRAGLAES
jgi:DNA-binding NarL/FixJ family response regulator